MSALRFHDPLWLLAAVAIVLLTVYSIGRDRRFTILYSSVDLLRNLPRTGALRLKSFLPWIRMTGLLLVVVALARPQKGLQEFTIGTRGVAIQMCLDRSGSMRAMDFHLDKKQVNRLTAVKHVFRNFVAGSSDLTGRPDDLIGLISFGGFAEGKTPLTLDHGVVLEVLDSIEIPKPVVDRNGAIVNRTLFQEELQTAIGDAVALAVNRLRDSDVKSKVIILLSDGENTAGAVSPEDAAKTAKTFGIKIYSIGVGTTGIAPFPVVDPFGRTVLRRQRVRLDEATLRMLAETTGGKYFNANDTESLQMVYQQIDELEKTKTKGRIYTEYRDLYLWFLLPGILLIVLEVVSSTTRFRSLP